MIERRAMLLPLHSLEVLLLGLVSGSAEPAALQCHLIHYHTPQNPDRHLEALAGGGIAGVREAL
jgi:hypothetical protein